MSKIKKISEKISSPRSWRNNIDRLREEYSANGYVIVDNFLPEEIALKLNTIYEAEAGWKQIDQVREHHYEHVFKTDSPYLPKGDEPYLAKFDRSDNLEKSEIINSLYDKHFKPALSEISGVPLSTFDIRCYRLKKGDFYRTHIDDYAGAVGLTYYINKHWVWDWGGILCVASDDQQIPEMKSILPVFNRAMLLDHKKYRHPHFVSPVTEYSKAPRYSIVSFNK